MNTANIINKFVVSFGKRIANDLINANTAQLDKESDFSLHEFPLMGVGDFMEIVKD